MNFDFREKFSSFILAPNYENLRAAYDAYELNSKMNTRFRTLAYIMFSPENLKYVLFSRNGGSKDSKVFLRVEEVDNPKSVEDAFPKTDLLTYKEMMDRMDVTPVEYTSPYKALNIAKVSAPIYLNEIMYSREFAERYLNWITECNLGDMVISHGFTKQNMINQYSSELKKKLDENGKTGDVNYWLKKLAFACGLLLWTKSLSVNKKNRGYEEVVKEFTPSTDLRGFE